MFKFFFKNRRFGLLLFLLVLIGSLNFTPLQNSAFLLRIFFGLSLKIEFTILIALSAVLMIIQNLRIARRERIWKEKEKLEKIERERQDAIRKAEWEKKEAERNARLIETIDSLIEKIKNNRPKTWQQVLEITDEWHSFSGHTPSTEYAQHMRNPLREKDVLYRDKVNSLKHLLIEDEKNAEVDWKDTVTVSDIKKQLVFNPFTFMNMLRILNRQIRNCHNDTKLKSYLEQFQQLHKMLNGKHQYAGYKILYNHIHSGWVSDSDVVTILSRNNIVFEKP